MGIEGWSYMYPINWREIIKKKLYNNFLLWLHILEWWTLLLNQKHMNYNHNGYKNFILATDKLLGFS